MEPEKYFDQIKAYLEDRLSPAEKEAFRKKLQTDEELQHAVDAYCFSISGLVFLTDEIARGVQDQIRQVVKKKKAQRRRLRAIVAIIAFLAVATGAWWYVGIQYTNEALFGSFYGIPSRMNPPQIAGEGQPPTPLQKGLEAYAGKKEEQALSILDSIAPDQPDYENARFALAQIYLQTGRNEEAIPYISPLTESLDTTLAAQSEWYLALALLQSNKIPECREWLGKIANDPSHPYYKKAGKLKKKLKSVWRIIVGEK